MKQIKTSELNPGNIFTKQMHLEGRLAFKVLEIPEEKNYIIVTDRTTGKDQRMFVDKMPFVILLHETEPKK